MTRLCCLGLLLATLATSPANAGDWIHWRGPEQNGVSKEEGLPDSFDLATVGKNNLLWKQPFGGRSAPLVMGGKVFVINGADMAKPTEVERIQCLDAGTGKLVWEVPFQVYLTDITSTRLGWTSLTADPAAGTIFAQTTAGELVCLNAKDGKIVWKRQLTEEFGRVTGYGGRIASPIFDSGLLIVGMVNGSWGDQARGANRFLAVDGKTGAVAWWSSPSEELQLAFKGTYYSNPVIAVIGGQRLLISGAADGAVHALKVRTGERVWSYVFGAKVVNPSPVVSVDGKVYVAHGDENIEGAPIGRVVCLDAAVIKDKQPALVWDTFRRKYKQNNGNFLSKRFGLSSPALADGMLFIPDDGGEMHVFDAKGGELLWRWKFGTVSRGAPLVAGGKLYIFDVNAKLSVLEKITKVAPDAADITEHRFRTKGGGGFVETNATPIAVNGKLYFQTRDDIFCVGDPKAKPVEAKYAALAAEALFDAKAAPAAILLSPADALSSPGKTVDFKLKFVDANGRDLPAPEGAKIEWTLPLPPKTPAGAQPPALPGEVKGEGVKGTVTIGKVPPSSAGVVEAKFGALSAKARIRAAAALPFKPDFAKIPLGGAPGGWVNTQGKFVMVNLAGKPVLSKVNNNGAPPIAKANAYITPPDAKDYTIQADMVGDDIAGTFPDMGLLSQRYVLVLDGKADPVTDKRQLRIVSWESRDRVNVAVDFDWKAKVWYTLKFTVEVDANGKSATLKGKVWEQGKAEPEKWTLEFKDHNPNKEGAGGLYGYIPNAGPAAATIHYDNVGIAPNAKGPVDPRRAPGSEK